MRPDLTAARRLIVKSPHEPALPRQIVKNAIHAMPRPRTRLRNLRSRARSRVNVRDGVHTRNNVVRLFLARLRSLPTINRQIPFVVIPTVFLPPFTRTAPRPRRRDDIPAHPAKAHAQRAALVFGLYFHRRNHRRTQHPKSSRRNLRIAPRSRHFCASTTSSILLPIRLSPGPEPAPSLLSRNRPTSPPRHTKILRTMRVNQFRHADIRLAHKLR